ncbi:acyltransferase [Gordonia shandongensis]|uniref:acyltransferase n=1 Tax=Gordonia shandongensis TaxID=376351 RepID=UPI00047B55FD|nr:acyltransferase [Gordonia shandongensis]
MSLVLAPNRSVQRSPAAPTATTAPAAGKRPYLHHVDLVRTTTFALVMFVHVYTSTTDQFGSVGTNATAILFHATRNIFFALTGFVLMYQYLDRPDFRATTFWRKRIKLVIIPYAIWSVLYWLVTVMWAQNRLGDVPSNLDDLGERLAWGTAAYHLYFLFVMLQVYVLFPLVRRLVTATRGHHGLLALGAGALQITVIAVMTYWTPPSSIADLWGHLYATFLPYSLVIVLGALAADHRDTLHRLLRGQGVLLVTLLISTGAFAVAAYLYRVNTGGPISDPLGAFQPTLLPFILVAAVGVYAMAVHWARTRRDRQPRIAMAVTYASNRSFPVFLVHVMVLFFLLRPTGEDGGPWFLSTIPQPLATPVVYLLTLAISLAVVEVLRRFPGSEYLTGRPRLGLRPTI